MDRRFRIGLLVAASLFIIPVKGIMQGNNVEMLIVDPGDTAYREGLYYFRDQLTVFIDSIGDRPIEEVASPSFQAHFYKDSTNMFRRWISDMGLDKACVWCRVTFDSRLEKEEEWLINMNAGWVDLYIPGDENQFIHHHTGTTLGVSFRPFDGSYGVVACLPFRLPAHDTLTVYFKLREVNSQMGNVLMADLDRAIFLPHVVFREARENRLFELISIGILLAVSIYHMIIFLYQRQQVSFYFSLFVFFMALVIFEYAGYFQEYLFAHNSFAYKGSFASITMMVGSIYHYLFSRKYLNLLERLPVLDKIWGTMLLIQVLTVSLFTYVVGTAGGAVNADPNITNKLIMIRMLSPLPILLLALTAAAIIFLKGNKAAGLYLIAMSTYTFQEMATQVTTNEWVKIPDWAFIFSGEAVTALIFALGIASQLRTLQREKQAAEQAEFRLKEVDAFKTRFYTNITHQFRTPLTIILGMAEQIRAHPSSWLSKGTDMIRRNGRRLLHLVNQILDLSKLEAGQLPVQLVRDDVIQYLKYIVESFHSSAEQKRIDLQFRSENTGLEVDYDPDKLMDILSNLLSNALKFTEEGGRVEVIAGVVQDRQEQFFIRVKDNGPGISEDALDRVFDRFFQSDTGQGTGIGLALTQELVHLLQGEIFVESKPGEGAAFLITLPITREAPRGHTYDTSTIREAVSSYLHPKNNELEGDASTAVSGRPTVLIVEDSPDVVTYLQAVLSPRFLLNVATNGKEGLEKALQSIPDLIVSDIMMPEMDGLEMCKALKTDILTSHIPIILLTAKSDHISRIEGLRTGADAYLAKPFDKTELLVRIDKLIELRKKLQERYRDIRFLFELNDTNADARHPEDLFMRKVHHIIEAHLGDPKFDVLQLCKELGMSRTHCYQKFKALTDQSPADFIRRIRLHKARQLLETTGLNVSEVAVKVGFKNLSTFSRNFKEEFGVSPSKVIDKSSNF